MTHAILLTDLSELRKELEAVSIPEDAPRMKAYMKNHFDFIGVKSKARKEASRPYLKMWLGTKNLDKQLVELLWSQPEREFQYIAMDYMDRTKKYWSLSDLDFFLSLIQTKSWWDTVDFLASHCIGGMIKKFPELKSEMKNWNQSDDMWVIRTSIIYQLTYKEEVDFEELKSFILAHAESKEFFIQKACGWSLRQVAKTYPQEVIEFVSSHTLSNLTKREALKHQL